MNRHYFLATLLVIFSLVLGTSPARADEWAHTIQSTDTYDATNSAFALDGVTWQVTTEAGVGSPSPQVYTSGQESSLRFGLSQTYYFSSVTLSTEFFKNRKVSQVDVVCRMYGASDVNMIVSQGSTTIGNVRKQVPSTPDKETLSAFGVEGQGGVLNIRFNISIGLNILALKVTYTEGGTSHTAVLTGITLGGEYPTTFTQGDAFSYQGMTVTAKYDDESTKDVTASAVFSGYDMQTVGSQTVTVSYTEAEVTKSADYDIVVNDLPDYTIAYYVDGVQVKTELLKAGATLTFPEVTVPDWANKVFVGWTTSPTVALDTKPTLVKTATATASADASYYAVYATHYNTAAYVLVSEQLDDWTGEYLIVNGNNASDAKIGTAKRLGEVSLGNTNRLAKDVIKANFGDKHNMQFVSCTGGYVMKLHDGSCYYITTGGTLSSSLDKATADKYPMTLDFVTKDDVRIVCSSRYLRYTNQTSPFTFISNLSTTLPISLYRRQDSYNTNYTTALTARFNIAAACTDGKKCYTTFSTDKAFVVPEDVTVEEVAVINDLIHKVAYTPGSVVPARTGVLISSVISGEHAALYSDEPGTSVLGAENLLRPSGDAGITASAMAEKDADCIYYRLTMHNGTQAGFWWGAEDGAAFDLAKNKAYLAVPKAVVSAVRGFDFVNAVDATEGVSAQVVTTEAKVYDLSGRCLRESKQRGLYIVDGKKVIR